MVFMTILDTVSAACLFVAIVVLTYVLQKYFKTMTVPPFWMYYVGGFLLLSFADFYSAMVAYEEPYIIIGGAVRLVAHLSILIGVYDLYTHYKRKLLKKKSKLGF